MRKLTPVLMYLLLVIMVNPVHANLLSNGGFEDAGTTTDEAQHWQWGNPDIHGGRWGTAARKQWHVRSGDWGGTILGSWAGELSGGWWQEVPATPGVTYTFSGWFKADGNWTNQADQGIKIEFFIGEENGQTLISDERLYFDGVGPDVWVQKTVSAVAPPNAQWVRAVIWVNEVGDQGALHFDDTSIVAEPGTVIILSSIPGVFLGAVLLGCVSRRWSFRG